MVTPELAAASFSGIVTGKVRGGIDDGSVFFGDAGFGGGDFGGPIGSEGFGTCGGNGGCALSVLRLGEAGGTASFLSDMTIGPGSSVCFLLDPGCACPG